MQLPRYDQNQVNTSILPAPQRPLSDPMAQALERAGGTLEGVADKGFELAHQEKVKADSSVVMDAYVNFSKQILDLQSDALMKKGKDALNFDPYLTQFDALYKDTKSKLSKDQQYLFDQHTAHERANFEVNLHRHANEQGQALNIENAKANVEIENQKLSTGYLDEANYDINNPVSQINKIRAATADLMHMQGIPDNDPAFKDAIDTATSKAYVDRVKLLMTEHPTEANKFFKEHENEIKPQQREALAKTVQHLSDEKIGIDAAFSYLQDIKDGKRTQTDITAELHEKFKDNPSAFKIAQAEINHLYTQNHADQVNEAARFGGKIEAAIDQAEGTGKSVSMALLKSIPEYNDLVKLAATGNKAAEMEVSKLRSYAGKVEHRQKWEKKQADLMAKQAAQIARENFMLDISDPETLKTMTETDLREQGRKHGLKYSQINQLVAERKRLIIESSNPKMLHNQNVRNDMINQVLDNANITDKEQRTQFGKAFRAFIKSKEDEIGRPLTDDEIKENGIKGLQWYAGKKGYLFGIGSTKGEWIGAGNYPKEFMDKVRAVESKRNIKMTENQLQSLYEEYLKEK